MSTRHPFSFVARVERERAFNIHALFYDRTAVVQASTPIAMGDNFITVSPADYAAYSVGDFFAFDPCEFSEAEGARKRLCAKLGGNKFYFVSPFESGYPAGTGITKVVSDLSLLPAASIAAPQSVEVLPALNSAMTITGMIFHGESVLEPTLEQFMGINGLANGLCISHQDGFISNKAVIRTNADFHEYFGGNNVEVIEKAPAGTWGINAYWNFLGMTGAGIELNGDCSDKLLFTWYDDLTGISELEIVVQGFYDYD